MNFNKLDNYTWMRKLINLLTLRSIGLESQESHLCLDIQQPSTYTKSPQHHNMIPKHTKKQRFSKYNKSVAKITNIPESKNSNRTLRQSSIRSQSTCQIIPKFCKAFSCHIGLNSQDDQHQNGLQFVTYYSLEKNKLYKNLKQLDYLDNCLLTQK